jgi:DNA repair photolyase
MGCEHSCIYCYAPYSLHYKDNENWGSFVKAKVNIPIILEKELKKTRPGIVGISTVVDPYQKAEEKFCLTKKCLDVLLPKDFPVCIQTKSPLVLRDLSLIKDFCCVDYVLVFGLL